MARTLAGATIALLFSLAAAGCGGSDGPKAPTVPSPVLYVTPPVAQLVAGGSPVNFTALLRGASGSVFWSMAPPGVGTISATSGTTIAYLPPAFVPLPTAVTLTARAAGMSDVAVIKLNPTPPTGSLVVSVTSTGSWFDGDGYLVRVDGGPPQRTWYFSDPLTFPIVSTGRHAVSIEEVADGCAVLGPRTVQVDVAADQTASVNFAVACGGVGSIRVSVWTATPAHYVDLQDPDGFLVDVDGGAPRVIGVYGTATFSALPLGMHTVSLSGLAANCTMASQNPLQVEVLPEATAEVTFAAFCAALEGTVRVTTTTTGFDLDQDGYTVVVRCDGGCPSIGALVYHGEQPIPASGSVLFTGVPEGLPHVTVYGLARNCSVAGPNPRDVSVAYSQTTDVAIEVQCVATGGLAVTTATSGVYLDPDGYRVTWSGAGQSETVAAPTNGTTSIAGLVPGVYQLTLGGLAPNCDGPRSATATVVAGAATPVAFDVACSPGRELAFASSADGNPEIYLVRTSRADLRRLTADPAADRDPAWSPDGARIAFASERDGNLEIYVMDADGSSLRRLTSDPAADHSPAWSPDGTRIAFVSERDGNPEIYVMGADGTNPVRLTSDPAEDGQPDWSPDGGRIAFSRVDDHLWVQDLFSGLQWEEALRHLYVMNADGTGASRITAGPVSDVEPDWSPDGSRIAFTRMSFHEYCSDWGGCTFYPGWMSVFVGQADGSGIGPLLWPWGQAYDTAPDWSPDGTKIAFTSGGWIFVVNADGTGELWQLTAGSTPAWRP